MKKFKNIEDFINCLKEKENLVGILKYGGSKCTDNNIGGDYDLTLVVKDNSCFPNIYGVHFFINEIPVDCMIRTLNDFYLERPRTKFDLAHIDAKILFDKDGDLINAINFIKTKWEDRYVISDIVVSKYKFMISHAIYKISNRLLENEIYSHIVMNSVIDIVLILYANQNSLVIGKKKDYLNYMKEHDSRLFQLMKSFLNETEIYKKYSLIVEIANAALLDYGGLWQRDEIIYHEEQLAASEKEKIELVNWIF